MYALISYLSISTRKTENISTQIFIFISLKQLMVYTFDILNLDYVQFEISQVYHWMLNI